MFLHNTLLFKTGTLFFKKKNNKMSVDNEVFILVVEILRKGYGKVMEKSLKVRSERECMRP